MEKSFKGIIKGMELGELKPKDRLLVAVPEPWSKDHVVQPAIWTRVNPFVAQFRGERPLVKDKLLFNTDFGRVYFSGEILDVTDEDVWLKLVQMAGKSLFRGDPVVKLKFRASTFIKDLRKYQHKTGGNDHQWLWKSLKRLQHGSIELVTKKKGYLGSFIVNAIKDEETDEIIVTLDSEFGRSYLNVAYTQINFAERLKIKGGLAKKLHSFLSGQRDHTNGYKYLLTVDEAREITGSKACTRKFRDTLKYILTQYLEMGFLKSATKINPDTWDLRLSNF